MRRLIFILCSLASLSAMAACPFLEGDYDCTDEGGEIGRQHVSQTRDKHPTLILGNRATPLLLNGRPQIISEEGNTGSYTASCSEKVIHVTAQTGGKTFSISITQTPKGYIILNQDNTQEICKKLQ